MMKDVDSVCRHVDPLIHRYLVGAAVLHSADKILRPFAYNYDVFSRCSNPRHVSLQDILPDKETVSTVPTPSVLYHYPIRFASHSNSLSTEPHPPSLSGLVVPPTNEVWFSLDSVVHSFGSFLSPWAGSNVKHYMFETSPLNFRIATTFHSSSTIQFTTLPHIFHHFHRFHHCRPLHSALLPRRKSSNYRTIQFFPQTQSCRYAHDRHTLTLYPSVPSLSTNRGLPPNHVLTPDYVLTPENVLLPPNEQPDIVLKPDEQPDIVLKPDEQPDIVLKPDEQPDCVIKPDEQPDYVLKPGVNTISGCSSCCNTISGCFTCCNTISGCSSGFNT